MRRTPKSVADIAVIQRELDCILASPIFLSAQRSQAFLRYVVQQSLAGSPLKEYEIAVEVLNRRPDYDPTVDATVRVEAGRLRTRLREYYQTFGKTDPILIDIPKGGYAAVFMHREAEPETISVSSAAGAQERAAIRGIALVVRQPAVQMVNAAEADTSTLAIGEVPRAGNSRGPNISPDSSADGSLDRILDRTPRKARRASLWIALAAAAAVIAVLTLWFVQQSHAVQPIRSLAVLPLANLSGDASQEYFADGMTDELITELARIRDLRVVSRTSVMQEKGLNKPLRQIASELNVDAVVEGSVVRSGDRVRITAQLIDARTDKHLWAQSFEARSSDILSLQDSIASQIASQARVVIEPASHARKEAARSIDPAAHDAYLRGRYFFHKQDWKHSASYFQQAIAISPTYASAYAGLADALEAQTTFQVDKPQELISKALAAANHAIALDPNDGEAYTALGSIQTIYEWNWAAAEQNLNRGIALSPNYSLAEMKYAVYLDAVGRPEDAVEHMRRAVSLDPISFFNARLLGISLFLARHYDDAIDQLQHAAEMEPDQQESIDHWLAQVYAVEGMRDQAVQHDLAALHRLWPNLDTAALSEAYKRGGWEAYWKSSIDASRPYANENCEPYEAGESYLRLGDLDHVFTALNQAVGQRCYEILWLKANPLLDPIRSDARYDNLLERVNLTR